MMDEMDAILREGASGLVEYQRKCVCFAWGRPKQMPVEDVE